MGILRTDRVSGLGGANAITGSVKFFGSNYISVGKSSDFALGTGDWTVEYWAYPSSVVSYQRHFYLLGSSGSNIDGIFANSSGISFGRTNVWAPTQVAHTINQWNHYALVHDSTNMRLYINGTQVVTSTDNFGTDSEKELIIGYSNSTFGGNFDGYISNFRIENGFARYTSAFTPPNARLTKTENTTFLGLQSSGNVLQEETGKVITLNRSSTDSTGPVASTFAPDKGEDHGTTFEDNTKFDTLSYMVPPGGTTAQSNRGRGVFGGGYTSVPSGASVKRMYYIQIDSMGTSGEFGDMAKVAAYGQGGCSSSTRGLFTGGTNPTNLQDIDYITIATTSNGLDFGDLRIQHGYTSSCSNETRGLTGGGRGVGGNQEIDYVTIATTGNGQDFGDLTGDRLGLGAFENSTRGYFSGGDSNPVTPAVVYKNIDTVLFATTGNATDFGDMTDEHVFHGTASSSTRGIMYGGVTSYGPTVTTNIIEYVTTSSTGSGTDFGDVRDDGEHAHGTSNSIRGVFAGGVNPYRNSVDYITIASTGNGLDWGDLPIASGSYGYAAGLSDSHGGIS